VITTGASQGRTIEDPQANPVEVGIDASREKAEQMFLRRFSL